MNVITTTYSGKCLPLILILMCINKHIAIKQFAFKQYILPGSEFDLRGGWSSVFFII